jgi:hypothetical protein
LLEWGLEGHPQLPCLPNRIAQDEPKQLALLVLLDFSGLLIVSAAIDSPVETVFVKSIESPLKPVQLRLIPP